MYSENVRNSKIILIPNRVYTQRSNCKDEQQRIGEQDRQCTYNVTMRRFRATIVAVEKL